MLQVPSSLPPCVPCPNAVAATNAQATTKGAIMFLTNFIFISVIFFHCFGLPWLPTVGGHFWPFTGVQNGNQCEVTGKMEKTLDCAKLTDWKCRGSRVGCFGLNAGGTHCHHSVTSAPKRRQFLRSTARRARDPRTALVLIRHS